jgi:tetratricopeptide (TPR) repeat protein
MSLDWLFTLLQAAAETIDAFLDSEWDAAKVLQSLAACVTIAGGGYGIWQAYRFAERRLADRLLEYLRHEDERLKSARTALLSAVTRGVPKRPTVKPVFSNGQLSLALKQLKWGRTAKAEASLEAALKLTEEKLLTADKFAGIHRHQKAAAHLLLGAIADSKKEHLAALQHFKAALELNPEDVEAIEYAGLQCLYIPDGNTALSYFNDLEQIATARSDDLLYARAKVLQARAYIAFAPAKWRDASGLLNRVVGNFPADMPTIERARIHELHGDIRRENGYGPVASQSYVAALALYEQARRHNGAASEATNGYDRVRDWLAKLNQSGAPQAGALSSAQGVPVPTPPIIIPKVDG